MIWTIRPFIGANELKFGASPLHVDPVLGVLEDKIERSNGYVNYYYHDIGHPVLGFRADKLIDITFGRGTEALFFDGLDFFRTPPARFLDKVRLHDPEVKRDALGEITSFGLGLAFNDADLGESDKTITLVSREQIERYRKFGPFTPA